MANHTHVDIYEYPLSEWLNGENIALCLSLPDEDFDQQGTKPQREATGLDRELATSFSAVITSR